MNWWTKEQKLTAPALGVAEDRLRALEAEVELAQREIARLRVELAAATERSNNYVQLVEQRIDLVHRQVVEELHRAFGFGRLDVAREDDVHLALSRLISGGFQATVDPQALSMRSILSDQLEVGVLNAPLTLHGFRVDRGRARDRGDAVEIFPVGTAGVGSALYGPYKRLVPGSYRVTFALRTAEAPKLGPSGDVALDVYSPGIDAVLGDISIAAERISLGESSLALDFDWRANAARDLIEMRLHQRSNLPLLVTSVTLERLT